MPALTWTTFKHPNDERPGRIHKAGEVHLSFEIVPQSGRFYLLVNGSSHSSGTLTACKAEAERIVADTETPGKPVTLSDVQALEDAQTAQDAAPVDSLPETDLASIDGAKIDSSPILGDATPIPRGWGSLNTPEPAPKPMPSASQITKPTGKSRGIGVAWRTCTNTPYCGGCSTDQLTHGTPRTEGE